MKRKVRRRLSKFLAVFLVLSMSLSLLSVTALAENGVDETDPSANGEVADNADQTPDEEEKEGEEESEDKEEKAPGFFFGLSLSDLGLSSETPETEIDRGRFVRL